MDGPLDSNLDCEKCGEPVEDEDASCPNCGVLFTDLFVCVHHPVQPAAGVCIVCAQPFCDECGEIVNDRFVCAPHAEYNIQEGMARVLPYKGTMDTQLATSCLEQAGLHPFAIASRGVYIPLPEVLQAERILKEVGLTTN